MTTNTRRINIGEQTARFMQMSTILGIHVNDLIDLVDYLTGDIDNPPEPSPTYGLSPDAIAICHVHTCHAPDKAA